MFDNQFAGQPDVSPVHHDPFATSAVAVLPGVPLPSAVLTAQAAERPAEPVPEPTPVAEPVAVTPAVAPVVTPAVAPAATPAAPPAGWYPDPAPQGNGQRYWDGAAWTHHLAP